MNKYAIDEIKGYKKEKEELQKIIDVLNNRNEIISMGGYVPKGLILYGNPGNGKTLFIKTLLDSIDMKVYSLDCCDYDFAKQLKKTIKKINKKKEFAIILVDELDKIFDYDECQSEELTALLTTIDGLEDKNNVFFLSSVNDFWCLPRPLVRPGRIDKKMEIVEPDYESRVEILKYYGNKVNLKIDVSYERLAKLTENQSCAGLKTLINECLIESRRRELTEDIISKFNDYIMNDNIVDDYTFHDLKVIATEEIAKFIVARNISMGDYVLNVNNYGSSSGRLFITYKDIYDMNNDDDDDYEDDDEDNENEKRCVYNTIFSKDEVEKIIKIKLAPIMIMDVLGEPLYTSSDNYYSEVMYYIDSAINNGFYGEKYIYTNDIKSTDRYKSNDFFLRREELVLKLIESFKKEVKEILIKDKYIYDKLLKPLMARKMMEDYEVEEILRGWFYG